MYEYFCKNCQSKFEQITSNSDPNPGQCPKCDEKDTQRLISRFAVGGQGDLRESTLHGCHGCHVSVGDEARTGPHDHHESNEH